MTTIRTSKTFGTLINGVDLIYIIRHCDVKEELPYLLKLSESTLAPEASDLYKKIWYISNCLQHPAILSERLMEIQGTLAIDHSSSALVEYASPPPSEEEEKKKTNEKQKGWNLFEDGLYGLSEEFVDYLWWHPTHTPLYDKFAVVQTKVKQTTRVYYQIQFLAIDISDELLIFQRKFQQSMWTTASLYNDLVILTADVFAFMYMGYEGIMVVEGIAQVANKI